MAQNKYKPSVQALINSEWGSSSKIDGGHRFNPSDKKMEDARQNGENTQLSRLSQAKMAQDRSDLGSQKEPTTSSAAGPQSET